MAASGRSVRSAAPRIALLHPGYPGQSSGHYWLSHVTAQKRHAARRVRVDCMDEERFRAEARGVRHEHHTRRSAPDPLAPIDAPTWLVVRDSCSQLLERTELPAGADQRAILAAARETRIAEGWQADEIGLRCSQFFATRGGERIMVGIERDPTRQIHP